MHVCLQRDRWILLHRIRHRRIRLKANLLVHVLHEERAGLVVVEMMPDGISSTSESPSKSTGVCWA